MSNCYAEPSSRGVYSIPRTGSIVDVMLNILDHDGPQPMKNMKPAPKHPNGADQFHEDHQGQYEARAKRSGDRVAQVNIHNSAYPMMKDELDKRRSTAKPTALRRMNAQLKCHSSNKDRRNRAVRKNKSKRQNNARTTGISKRPKAHKFTSPNVKLSMATNIGCQCKYLLSADSKCVATCVSKYNMDASVGGEMCKEESAENNPPASNTDIRFKNESNSEIESRNPDTSEPSISSYDSYMSMDHEPMVSS